MLGCRFSIDIKFNQDSLWNKVDAIPEEMQERMSSIHNVSLTYLGVDAGADDLAALEIDDFFGNKG